MAAARSSSRSSWLARWDPCGGDALPVDKLALAVLRDFKDDGGWNSYNWMIAASQRYGRATDIMRALSESWSWLQARGLIARDFSQSANEAILVTRAGERVLRDGLAETLATERLQLELHPELVTPVRTTFMAGDYDTAVLKALKQVEVRVRRMTGAKPSLVGVKLMQEAFRTDGPFWSDEMDAGEQVGRMDLFKRAIGFLKNPASHREVDYDDPSEAAEAVMLASLLMRVLDRIEAARGNPDMTTS